MAVTDAKPRMERQQRALRMSRYVLLAGLALAAIASATLAESGDLGHVERRFTAAALLLGLGSILARGRAVLARDTHSQLAMSAASLLLAAAIGALGLWLALARGQGDAGLLYTLGSALLAARAPLVRPIGEAPAP